MGVCLINKSKRQSLLKPYEGLVLIILHLRIQVIFRENIWNHQILDCSREEGVNIPGFHGYTPYTQLNFPNNIGTIISFMKRYENKEL